MNDNRWVLLGLVAVTFLTGCASTSAPDAWTSSAQSMQREAYGAWVEVTSESMAGSSSKIQGELIAVHEDSLFILPLQGSLRTVSRSSAHMVRLTTFDANQGYLGIWTLLGTLSTVSHGYGLVFSAPVWILGGTAATANQSHQPIETDPSPEILRQYARFPQGLPPALTTATLTAKPLRER